jgi:hypothetical protein
MLGSGTSETVVAEVDLPKDQLLWSYIERQGVVADVKAGESYDRNANETHRSLRIAK